MLKIMPSLAETIKERVSGLMTELSRHKSSDESPSCDSELYSSLLTLRFLCILNAQHKVLCQSGSDACGCC